MIITTLGRQEGQGFLYASALFFKAFFLNWIFLLFAMFKKLGRLTPLQLIYILALLCMLAISLRPWFTYRLEFFEEEQKLASSLRWFFSLTACIALFFFFLDIAYRNLYVLLSLLLNAAVYIWGFFAPGKVHSPMLLEASHSFSLSYWLYGFILGATLLISTSVLGHSPFGKVKWKSYLLTRPEI